MFKTIVLPLDGSPLGEHAIPYAAHLARAAAGRLLLVHTSHDAASRRKAESDLANVTERLWTHGVAAETHVRAGSPSDLIPQAATTWDADVIAMSTHGRSGLGRWLYGSVADHVLRHATVPVLLVSPTCNRDWAAPSTVPNSPDMPAKSSGPRASSVLVPLDGTDRGEGALDPAWQLAEALGADVSLLRVVPPPLPLAPTGSEVLPLGAPPGESVPGPLLPVSSTPYRPGAPEDLEELPGGMQGYSPVRLTQAVEYLAAIAARPHPDCITVHTRGVMGWVPAEILAQAQRDDVAAIAMATHGHAGLTRMALGSVATDVLRRATTPLLLVGPHVGVTPRKQAPA